MALIKCPQCGKQVSEHAQACPQCGLQLSEFVEFDKEQQRIEAENISKAAEWARVRKEHRQEWWSKNKRKVGITIIIVFGIVIGVCCINLLMTKHKILMAMSLVEQGDDFANNYQKQEIAEALNKEAAEKHKQESNFHNHATNSNEGLLLNLHGTIGTAPGTLIFNDDDKYYTYQLSSGTVKRTIKLVSRDGATLIFESYDKSGKYIGKFVGNWSNGIYSGTFTNYKNISINFKLRNK